MATTYLTRTSGTPTNALKWTYSVWVKNSQVGTGTFILDFNTDTNNRSQIGFESDGKLTVYEKVSGATSQLFQTNALYRDLLGWYNFVISCDRTLGTASDRTKIYVNGVRETSFSASDNPAQNTNGIINTAVNTLIGKYSQSGVYFNGLLSHVHFVDGTAYPASTFGSTDSTTGEWEINTSPTVTYGNNGFFILKNGNSVNDQSGNANNFTVGGGALTKTEDCPSNVFSTINPLYNQTTGQGVTPTFGNNLCYYGSDSSRSCLGSTSPSSGKYYYEAKIFDKTNVVLGIVNLAWGNLNGASGYSYHDDALNFGYNLSGQKTSGGSSTSFGSAINNNDIFMCAMDLDNQKLYFGLNGTWQGSGDPTSGATGTGSAFNLAAGANYASACRLRNGTQVGFNFGNGYYSSSDPVSSAGTNASGIGIFEYDVPTGYTALSTKGLNE